MTCLLDRIVKNKSHADQNPVIDYQVFIQVSRKFSNLLTTFPLNSLLLCEYNFPCKFPSDISKDTKNVFLGRVTQVSTINALSRVTKYPRVVSSWSLVDFRSLIGTDDVLPLVVSPHDDSFRGSISADQRLRPNERLNCGWGSLFEAGAAEHDFFSF